MIDPSTGVPIDFPAADARPPIRHGQGLRRFNYHDRCGTNLVWPPQGYWTPSSALWCPRCQCPVEGDKIPSEAAEEI